MANFFVGVLFGFMVCGIVIWLLGQLADGVFDQSGTKEALETIESLQKHQYGVEVFFYPKTLQRTKGKLRVRIYSLGGSVVSSRLRQTDLLQAIVPASVEALGREK